MTSNDLVLSLLGGAVIGLSATWLFGVNGRVAGVSGIVAGLLSPTRGETPWRFAFAAGLVAGGVVLRFSFTDAFGDVPGDSRSLIGLAVAGLLVGFGTRMGSGCTSGHGICGVSRLSPRSIVATVTFIATGALALFVARHGLGVAP